MAITASSVLASNSLEDFRIEFNNLVTDVDAIQLANTFDTRIIFEGSTVDGFETALTLVDPTADRSIVLPNVSGNLIIDGNPISADGESLGTASLEWSDAFLADSAVIYFGDDQDVTLTHVHDTGLSLNLMMAATTFEPTGDTASGDNAAIGYTSVLGLILTGEGSTNDVTIVNDDDVTVMGVATGTTTVNFAGQVTGTGFTGTLDGILGSGSAAAATVTTLVTSGIVSVDDTTTSTSGTTGSIHTDGGLGVAGTAFVAGAATVGGILSVDDTTTSTSGTTGSIHTDGGLGVAGTAFVAGTAKIVGVTTHGDDVVSDTDSTDDLGTTGVRWANLFVDAITATDQITATGFTGTLDGILGSGAAAAATTTTLASTTITASGIIKTDDTTAATSTTDGSLQTDGGLSVVLDAVIGDDIILISDAAAMHFGVNSEITLTHVHDVGLNLKHTATADDKPIILTLQTGETDMAANDVMGKIAFQAPDEGTGTDAVLVAAAIQARAEGDFSSSSNATSLEFMTGASEAATTKMTLKSDGKLGVGTTSAVSLIEATGDTPEITITSSNPLEASTGTEDISSVGFRGQKNNLYRVSARIQARQDGTWSTSDAPNAPSALEFYTQSSGSGDGMAAPRMTIDASGDVAITGGITGLTSINKGQIGGRRNIIYNGEMKVAQRSASETGLGAATGYFTLDRWEASFSGTAGRLTMAQIADGPPGFANCLKLTTTTADTSIAAGEFVFLQQKLEGQDLQHLKKGTASAEQVTVSFYVKGNANAIYVCELFDSDNGRHITQSFAVTTSWNRIELTFAADTSDPLNDDNALSLYVTFWLHAGATYTGGTFASNTWADNTNANRAAVDDFTSILDATDRTFFITGVQMEIGATATEFESRTYGEELTLCQRYTWKYGGNISDEYLANVGFYSDGNSIIFGHIRHPVIMRATPSLTVVGSPIIKINGGANTGFTPVISAPSVLGAMINMQKTSHGLTTTDQTSLNTPGTTDHFLFVAEL